MLLGDQLIDDLVDQGDRVFGAYRAGWDFGHYWGTELRFAFAHLEAIDVREGVPSGDSRNLYWDGHLLYYPWGDAKWRPYASVGLGMASFRFRDSTGRRYNEVLLDVPYGIGVKYRCRRWWIARFEVVDNLAVSAAGVDTMHNISMTGGVEVRFGARPTSYYPWGLGCD